MRTHRIQVVAFISITAGLLFGTPQVRADAPTTAPAAPYVLIQAANLQQVDVGDRHALCDVSIAGAVKAALASIKPTTQPTTMPSDLVDHLAAARGTLVRQMTADLNVPADKSGKFLDETVKPALQRLVDLKPRVYVVVATQQQVTAAIRAGWHAPLFRYNPLADHTFYLATIGIPTEGAMDDTVLWAEVQPGASDHDVADAVQQAYEIFGGGFAQAISNDGMVEVRNLMIKFVNDNSIAPLKLPWGEQWLGMGIAGTMGCKYSAPILGISREDLTAALAADNPENPIKPASVDLMHSFDPNSVKSEYMALYVDAVSRKATKVMADLLKQAGDGAVAKILTAIAQAPPADNDGLVQVIQKTTGVDLTQELGPPAF
jgi:hypothetical protein